MASYSYDYQGRRISRTVSGVTTKYCYDGARVIAEYEYDELSRRTLLTFLNDANAVYEYDLGNRLKKLTNNLSSSNSIVFDYNDYDKVGNRLNMKVDDANAHEYTYDCLYQLTDVNYNDGNSMSYFYDRLGSRTSVVNGGTTSYVHNCLNQYTSVGGTNYSYDENGDLTNDGTYKYYYDCENRLTDVNNQSDQAVVSYKYDYLGRRVKKTVYGSPDVITKYCYDGDQVIAEYDGSNTLLRKFIYGPGIDESICMFKYVAPTGIYYYHFDGLGSVVALSNNVGNIVERYSYDVFGEPNTTSSVGNPYLFTGRRYDDESDLYYYRARYYNPHTGRFLQTDPISYEGGLNLYTYVANNPINYIDPTGQFRIPIIDNIIEEITREAEHRRGHGPWDESAQHCWAACVLGIRFGAGRAAAYIHDIADILTASGCDDTVRDIAAQHVGGTLGDLLHPNILAMIFAGRICDRICMTWP